MSSRADSPETADTVVDWREVIGCQAPTTAQAPRVRQPLRPAHALLLALLVEGAVIGAVAGWLDYHPPQHGGATARQPAITAQLLLHAMPTGAPHTVHDKGGRNPRVGLAGGHRAVVAKPVTASRQSGGSVMKSSVSGQYASTQVKTSQPGRRQTVAAVLPKTGNCARHTCVQADALHRYERRLHDLLQTRLRTAAGAAPARVTLRFYAAPQGGVPTQVSLLDVQAGASTARSLLQRVQRTRLPPFPRDLGRRALALEVTLRR
ncbi:hypothetical protein [Acidihalobacter ferrooxydans]|uniref:Uncharacterized protein n=1 Tax=Acidihalobacter ferrooxydans TaxID=1765967 RepID=A0A1P8UDT4_9GAMM|nr:hypothetical protein [Acidihalobacter ferrooxydans]APZ41949.1 hypothetical protein BW247_01585 [Acidihalobacter ferrooxydans]